MERLSKFINESFTRWHSVNLNDLERLVIDGDSVCAQLYQQHHGPGRLLGGEYLDFHSTVKEFFAEILFTGVQLLVMFGSGIEGDVLRVHTVYYRNTHFYETVRCAQGRIGWQAINKVRTTPLMATIVFIDVLRSLGTEFRVVTDGDARKEVAAFANHFKCPVLAAHSDFFMFELDCGYMPMDRLSTVIANGLVYQLCEFQSQFGLKGYKLRLVIPALYGNDCIKGVEAGYDFESALQVVSDCESCEEYLANKDDKAVRKNFEAAIKFYCDLPVPADYNPRSCVTSGLITDLPEWVFDKFRIGCFESQLLRVRFSCKYALRTLVDDIKRDSAWLTSRHIRQFLYGLMGVSGDVKVKEIIRAKSSPEVTDAHVSPSNFNPPVMVRDLTDKNKETLADMVLSVLNCYKLSQGDIVRELNTLDDKWKLPIAATFYWYRACDNPQAQRHLVKSLLVSFLKCSGELKARIPPLEPVTRETKADHLTSLHALAQWQCVYYDAMSLNYLAREPFPATSPACLYSGEVAMYCASLARKNQNVDDAIVHGSEEWKLYNKFLYLITGYDNAGRRGDHAKHQPKQKVAPLSRDSEVPSLLETNRYSSLSTSEQA